MADQGGPRRLYKSRTERMVDGVCGGVAQYFTLDPTLVRIAWVLLTLLGGSGIVLYIIAMIVMPKEPYFPQNASGAGQDSAAAGSPRPSTANASQRNSLFWGIMLIIVGTFLFLHNIGFSFWHPWWWFDKDIFLPVLLLLAGVAFLWGGRNSMSKTSDQGAASEANSVESSPAAEPAASPRRVHRSFKDHKLFGVCGGLAEYFDLDSSLVRILAVVCIFATSGAAIIGYVVLAIVLPKEYPSLSV